MRLTVRRLAKGLLLGEVIVDGNAGNGAAASICGGTVVPRGAAAPRAGVGMKGGRPAGRRRHRLHDRLYDAHGTIVVCDDARPALADSMYEGLSWGTTR